MDRKKTIRKLERQHRKDVAWSKKYREFRNRLDKDVYKLAGTLPCPICGKKSNAELHCWDYRSGGWRVSCSRCDFSTPEVKTLKCALKIWKALSKVKVKKNDNVKRS